MIGVAMGDDDAVNRSGVDPFGKGEKGPGAGIDHEAGGTFGDQKP